MAEFTYKFSEDFFKQLEQLENTDEIQEKMLKESAPILVEAMKKYLSKSIVDGTGELVDSIKAANPNKTENGWYVFVRPTGYSVQKKYYAQDKRGKKTSRKYKLSNAAKAIWLEYGTSKQMARPFLTKTTNDANDEVIEKMQEVFNEVIK